MSVQQIHHIDDGTAQYVPPGNYIMTLDSKVQGINVFMDNNFINGGSLHIGFIMNSQYISLFNGTGIPITYDLQLVYSDRVSSVKGTAPINECIIAMSRPFNGAQLNVYCTASSGINIIMSGSILLNESSIDNYDINLEAIPTNSVLLDNSYSNRPMVVRPNNLESDIYIGLGSTSLDKTMWYMVDINVPSNYNKTIYLLNNTGLAVDYTLLDMSKNEATSGRCHGGYMLAAPSTSLYLMITTRYSFSTKSVTMMCQFSEYKYQDLGDVNNAIDNTGIVPITSTSNNLVHKIDGPSVLDIDNSVTQVKKSTVLSTGIVVGSTSTLSLRNSTKYPIMAVFLVLDSPSSSPGASIPVIMSPGDSLPLYLYNTDMTQVSSIDNAFVAISVVPMYNVGSMIFYAIYYNPSVPVNENMIQEGRNITIGSNNKFTGILSGSLINTPNVQFGMKQGGYVLASTGNNGIRYKYGSNDVLVDHSILSQYNIIYNNATNTYDNFRSEISIQNVSVPTFSIKLDEIYAPYSFQGDTIFVIEAPTSVNSDVLLSLMTYSGVKVTVINNTGYSWLVSSSVPYSTEVRKSIIQHGARFDLMPGTQNSYHFHLTEISNGMITIDSSTI